MGEVGGRRRRRRRRKRERPKSHRGSSGTYVLFCVGQEDVKFRKLTKGVKINPRLFSFLVGEILLPVVPWGN